MLHVGILFVKNQSYSKGFGISVKAIHITKLKILGFVFLIRCVPRFISVHFNYFVYIIDDVAGVK